MVLATHSIRQLPLHFPYRVSPCAITFQLDSNSAGRGLLSKNTHFAGPLTLLAGATAPLATPRNAPGFEAIMRGKNRVLAKGKRKLPHGGTAALRDRTLFKGYLTLKILRNVGECLSADMT